MTPGKPVKDTSRMEAGQRARREREARGIPTQAAELTRLRAQVAAVQAREGRLMAMAVEARRHMASVNEESPAVEAVCVILERMQARAP